jgi:hypothetical protein
MKEGFLEPADWCGRQALNDRQDEMLAWAATNPIEERAVKTGQDDRSCVREARES